MCGAERRSVVNYVDKIAHHVEKRATKVKGVPHGIRQTRLPLTDWLTDWLLMWSRFLVESSSPTASPLIHHILWKLNGHCCVNRNLPLSWARSIQSTPPTLYLKDPLIYDILISTLKSSKWSLSVRFPHQTLYAPILFPIYTTCLSNLILVNFITQVVFGEEYKSWSSSLCTLLPFSYLFPCRPKHHFQTPSAYVSSCVRDHVSHPCKTRQSYSSVYFSLCVFGQQMELQNMLNWMVAGIPWVQSARNFVMNAILIS